MSEIKGIENGGTGGIGGSAEVEPDINPNLTLYSIQPLGSRCDQQIAAGPWRAEGGDFEQAVVFMSEMKGIQNIGWEGLGSAVEPGTRPQTLVYP